MRALYDQVLAWLSEQGPDVLAATLLFILALPAFRLVVQFFKRNFLRARKDDLEDNPGLLKRANTIANVSLQTGRLLIWAVYLVTILPLLGINIGPLLAGAGILGLAIGFGSQELVRDTVSGFFNLLENNFRVGDVVTINGVTGTVESIELRTTQLRDNSGNLHIFQNGKINQLTNLTKDWSAVTFKVEVPAGLKLGQVLDSMKEAGDHLLESELASSILEPVEVLGLDDFTGSKMLVKARIKTKPGEQWVVGRAYRVHLKKELDEDALEVNMQAEGKGTDPAG